MDPRFEGRWRRLESERGRLLSRLGRLPEDVLNRSPAPGRWSMIQVVTHLTLSEEGALSYLRKKVQDPSRLKRAGVASLLRRLALGIALRSPLRARAPAIAVPDAEPVGLQVSRERWDQVRAGLQEFLDGFPADLLDRAVMRHPSVGRLRLEHTLGFLQDHFDHHVRQIERIGRRISAAVPRH